LACINNTGVLSVFVTRPGLRFTVDLDPADTDVDVGRGDADTDPDGDADGKSRADSLRVRCSAGDTWAPVLNTAVEEVDVDNRASDTGMDDDGGRGLLF
jgi:hypothetical protein